jgi:tellurite methyltransferase
METDSRRRDASPVPAGGRVLDIRPAAAFRAGHLPGAVSWPVAVLPAGADPEAHFAAVLPSIFLPPREVPLLVLGDDPSLTAALAIHLEGRGRAPVRPVTAAELPATSLHATGASRAHLWEPPAWLVAHCGLLPPPAAGPVLDLACGSGRAAVWLAARGYRVTAVDHQPEALALGERLAAPLGVAVAGRQADLRHDRSVPPGAWAAVLNFRFLHRPLLAGLAARLQPGGVALVRTFRDVPGDAGHPNPRHRLAPGELLRHFGRGVCEILAHEESHDPDGRPAAGIVARRLPTA